MSNLRTTLALAVTLAVPACSHHKDEAPTTPATMTPAMADAGTEEPMENAPESGGSSYAPGATGVHPGAPDDGAGVDQRMNRENTSEGVYPADAGPGRRTQPAPSAPAEGTPLPHTGPPASGTTPPPAP